MNPAANGRQNMKKRISTIVMVILSLALVSACGGGGAGSVGVGTSAPSLVSIEVTPAAPVIALGTEAQLTATGIYSDNSKKDLTSSVEWHSSDETVVTVSRGLARSVGRGSAVIGVQSGKVEGSRPLTVTDASLVSIQVTPVNPEAPLGMTRQFTATGIFSDDSVQDLTQQVSWNAADGAVASVSDEAGTRGLATPVGMGSTAVSAALDGVTGSTGFTVTEAVLVSIQITPSAPCAPKGTTLQLTATGIYSDHSTQDLTGQVTWGSSDPSVASVSSAAGSNGRAGALAVGPATVSASFDGVTGSTELTVTEAALVSIQVTPENPSLPKGTTRQLTATGLYSDNTTQDLTGQVTWATSDPSVASVSNAAGTNGLASALTAGPADVIAALGTVYGAASLTVTAAVLVSIEVNPCNAVTAMGVTRQFTASGVYSDSTLQDLTQQATWGSSVESVAAISNADGSRGLATPAGIGSTVISAALEGVWGSTALTVSSASLVSVTVTPDGQSLQGEKTMQFSATGHYSNGMFLDITTSATWKSSDNKVAKVSNAKKTRGLVTGGDAGNAAITATLSNVSGSSALTVW